MPPSQSIIDFNRCFEPNAFNTGPSIPRIQTTGLTAHNIYSPFPRSGAYALGSNDIDLPELSNSPASTISSTTSLQLDDEEIKRIFSQPRYITHDLSQKQRTVYYPLSQPFAHTFQKENLNPHAQQFVPSFATHGGGSVFVQHDSLVNSSQSFQCGLTTDPSPLVPPGLSHTNNRPFPRSVSNLVCAEPPSQRVPTYMPFLIVCLKPSTTRSELQLLVRHIVTSYAAWDVKTLLDLVNHLFHVAFDSGSGFDNNEPSGFACHPYRYTSMDDYKAKCQKIVEDAQKPETVAIVAAEIQGQLFSLHGKDTAQAFVWNIREITWTRFLQCWDFTKPGSITLDSSPPPYFVRSSILLCKVIASLFTTDLVNYEQIRRCISVLLQDLMSVEHIEAAYNIVLGCGQKFWASGPVSEADDSLLPKGKVLHLTYHVHAFVTGLDENIVQRNLQDHSSLLGQSWSSGQLVACWGDIVGHVRLWERSIMLKYGEQISG